MLVSLQAWQTGDVMAPLGGGAERGVGILALVAVDALGHPGDVGGLVEANSFWWLVLVVGESEQLLVVGVGTWFW